jgi:signal recognition particle receptor subunit beta
MDEARRELEKVLHDREMRNTSLLVLCNKQDVSGSMPPAAIRQALHLEKFNRPCAIMPCSALDGSGLTEGLKWLSKHCK